MVYKLNFELFQERKRETNSRFHFLWLKVFADSQVLKENKLGKLVREKSLLLIALNLIKMTNYFWASASNKTCLIGGNQLISK